MKTLIYDPINTYLFPGRDQECYMDRRVPVHHFICRTYGDINTCKTTFHKRHNMGKTTIEDIQIFGIKMPYAYTFIASRDEINGIFMIKN